MCSVPADVNNAELNGRGEQRAGERWERVGSGPMV